MIQLEILKERYADIADIQERSRRRVFMMVPVKDSVHEIVSYLFRDLGARFSTITSIEQRGHYELMYHMNLDSEGVTVSVCVEVKKPEPSIRSVTDAIEGAEWVEREIHEMFGIDFEGHPHLKRLLLPDDWPDGQYPYRKKSFDSEREVKEKD